MRTGAGLRRVGAVPMGASRREGFTTEGAESTEENRTLESPVGALSRARLGAMKTECTTEDAEGRTR